MEATKGNCSRHSCLLFAVTLLLSFSFVNNQKAPSTSQCYISNGSPQKASPSLLQCYRNNGNTCCNEAVDNDIKNWYGNIFPASCNRNFPDFEIFTCLACSPFQPTATSTGKLRVCKSMVERIWGGDITKSSTVFDQCGLNNLITQPNTTANTFRQYSLPSSYYANATAFLNDYKPPYFEFLTLEIAMDNQNCFDTSYISAPIMKLMLSLLVVQLLYIK